MKLKYMLLAIGLLGCLTAEVFADTSTVLDPPGINWKKAAKNAELASEGFERSQRSVGFWLKQRAQPSGLFGDRAVLDKQRDKIWNVHNAAADNYAFHVLTSALTVRSRYTGEMLDMLKSISSV